MTEWQNNFSMFYKISARHTLVGFAYVSLFQRQQFPVAPANHAYRFPLFLQACFHDYPVRTAEVGERCQGFVRQLDGHANYCNCYFLP